MEQNEFTMEQNEFRTEMHMRIDAYLELERKQEEIIESLTEEDFNTLRKVTQIHEMSQELGYQSKGMNEVLSESGSPFTEKDKAVMNFLRYKNIEGNKVDDDDLPF